MADEAAPEIFSSDSSCHFSFFLFNPTFSDLKIFIGNEQIAAHKIILCRRSHYFADVLLKDITTDKLSFDDVDIGVFKELLRFLYTDTLCFDILNLEVFIELMKLAKRFSAELLESELVKNLRSYLKIETCCNLLNISVFLKMEKITKGILEFMDLKAELLLNGNYLNILSQEAMVRLLSRDDFIAIEMQIFEGVSKWLQNHEDKNNLVADCIKLERFSKKELWSVLGPSDFVNKSKLLNVLLKMENGSLVIPAREVRDKNLATVDVRAKLISGIDTEHLLSGNSNDYAYHFRNGKSSIIIELKCIFAFNNIKFKLLDTHKNFNFSYYVEVSTDNKNWQKIIDYQDFKCRSYQNLFFETTSAKFLKFVGTASSSTIRFYLSSVEIYLRDETPQVVNGIIRPADNVATPPQAIVFAEWNPDALLNGNQRQIWGNLTSSSSQGGNVTIQLAQPFLISSVRLLLNEDEEYNYLIETSVNREDWQLAVDKRNKKCTGWQTLRFEERPVVFIRITGRDTQYDSEFWCRHFESPAT